jgi:hypothetical protein
MFTEIKVPRVVLLGKEEVELVKSSTPEWMDRFSKLYGYTIDGIPVREVEQTNYLDVE